MKKCRIKLEKSVVVVYGRWKLEYICMFLFSKELFNLCINFWRLSLKDKWNEMKEKYQSPVV